jgi:hypothetical protein
MTTPELDAMTIAQEELARAMVPAPDDLLADVGPLAQLLFIERTCYSVLQSWAAMLSGDEAADVDDDSGPVRALAAIGQAAGNLDAACVEVSILPPDATEG